MNSKGNEYPLNSLLYFIFFFLAQYFGSRIVILAADGKSMKTNIMNSSKSDYLILAEKPNYVYKCVHGFSLRMNKTVNNSVCHSLYIVYRCSQVTEC